MVTRADSRQGEREKKRAEFYRIIRERLDARIERGEAYTTTSDLARGYEKLHAEAFGTTMPPSQSVAQVMSQAAYRDRLFYARDTTTHKAERVAAGRRTAYRVYLRADATPPKEHILVPITVSGSRIGEYIAHAKGADDATVHVTQPPRAPQRESQDRRTTDTPIDFRDLSREMVGVMQAQMAMLDRLIATVSRVLDGDNQTPHTPLSAGR